MFTRYGILLQVSRFLKCKFEDFNLEGEFKGAGQHMEVSKLQNEKKDKLVIMRSNSLCQRSVNF